MKPRFGLAWAYDPIRNQYLVSGQLKKTTTTADLFSANAITLASRHMFVTTLGDREGKLFFSRPQSSEFPQSARLGMLEKVSNSQPKPLAIRNCPAISWEHLIFYQRARFLWGTDKVRNRFYCPDGNTILCSCRDLSVNFILHLPDGVFANLTKLFELWALNTFITFS